MVAWLADLAMQGVDWARQILDLKPCDLWPQIRGRTVWVVGDSISQVGCLIYPVAKSAWHIRVSQITFTHHIKLRGFAKEFYFWV